MRLAKTSLTVLASMMVLLGLFVGGALAQEAPADGDGYPVDVDDEVLADEDVIDPDPDPEPEADEDIAPEVVEGDEDVAVLGQQLAVTGGRILMLLAAGMAIAAGGLLFLNIGRRAREAESRG